MQEGGRSRAILAGLGVPLGAGYTAILVFYSLAASDTAWGKTAGPLNNLIMLLPGTLALGLLFGTPIALAHVFTMAWLSRRFVPLDSLIAWALAGPVFSSPLAAILSILDGGGAPPYFLILGLCLGLVGGEAAGLFRPRPIHLPTARAY